jgi:hypothetical protein
VQDEVIKLRRRGLLRFQLGEGEGAAGLTVDAFLFFNEVAVIQQRFRDGTGAELPHYIDLLRRYGAPPDVTATEAVDVINAVVDHVAAEKKSTETPPCSAGATASTAGGSSPGSGA